MIRGTKRSVHSNLFGTRELARNTRCAVIVAHPDDEVIGAGGLLSRLDNVVVLHVTNGVGNASGASNGKQHQAENAQTIREECRSALALANIQDERIIEFGIGSEQAKFSLAVLARKIATFLQHAAPDVVLTHPYEGGHPDHDATAFGTHTALRLLRRNGLKPPVVFEIAVRPGSDTNERVLDFLPNGGSEITTFVLDKKARDLKRQMFACFTTQPEFVQDNSFGRERFRRPPAYDFAAPPFGEVASEKRPPNRTNTQWKSLVQAAWLDLFPDEAAVY